MASSEPDELFEVANSFYLGNFQHAIMEAQKLKITNPEKILERDVLLHRAYIAQGRYRVVLDEVTPGAPEQLQAVRMLAEYLSDATKREAIVAKLDKLLTGKVDIENHVLLLMGGIIFLHENNLESALRLLHLSDNLECRSTMCLIYLKMNRIDLAKKELKTLQEKDEDSTVTQLTQSWINMAANEKIQDAFFAFQELQDKHNVSSLLLTSQASCHILQGRHEEGESLLQEALNKDPNNSDALLNVATVSQLLGKPSEVCKRYISQLNTDYPILKEFAEKEREFDRLCAQYTPSKTPA